MFNDRNVVFKALVGSHNYNLNDATSDKDWKYFVLPTFDDLYTGKYFSTSKVGTDEDYDCHDIRRLSELFFKANVNFLEVLYSKEIEAPLGFFAGYELLESVFELRESIVTMNLPYLYSACKGMFHEKMKRIQSPTSGTKELMDKYGYDTKQALHAYRILGFILRFHQYNWDFQRAITFTDAERDKVLMIKHGALTLDEFKEFVNTVYYNDFQEIEEVYKSKEPNLETKATLESLIKELVRRNL